ncbi:hypothetical protein ACFV97_22325 [Streptomyces sp. NPDC059913]|uniref:hypothetical protein n=1 Tax=unclassified Streptomyces TaxID=2593676 RepID=UPI00365C48DB
MSNSDQDQEQGRSVDAPIAADTGVPGARTKKEAGAEADAGEKKAATEAEAASEVVVDAETGADAETDADADEAGDRRLTPRQARRLRMALSAVGMAAMAVVLALRIASRSSVLVVGVYGLALILCGIVIELSRNGRTRLGSWLLAAGLVAAIGSDWLLIP